MWGHPFFEPININDLKITCFACYIMYICVFYLRTSVLYSHFSLSFSSSVLSSQSKIGAPFSYLTSDFGAAVERPQQQKGISNRAHMPPLAKVTRPACGTGFATCAGPSCWCPTFLLSACNTTEGGREESP